MNQIRHDKNPDVEMLKTMGVFQWPIWEADISEFPWTYEMEETCYILEGRFVVTPKTGGDPVEVGPGDFVVFPKGLDCVWKILEPVRKHYSFS